jgi:hypothetical protein
MLKLTSLQRMIKQPGANSKPYVGNLKEEATDFTPNPLPAKVEPNVITIVITIR